MKLLLLGHLGRIQKADNELVHVSPTRSREFALEFSKAGIDTTAGVFYDKFAGRLSETLQYKHIDNIVANDYDVVFLHLLDAIHNVTDMSNGIGISRKQLPFENAHLYKDILNHPRIYLQLDAPRALAKDVAVHNDLIKRIKCTGVATENAVIKWNKMCPGHNVEWVNAATIAYKYAQGDTSPYPESDKPRVVYLGRMNDASAVPPLQKLHHIAKLLPDVEFHVVTNKVRDAKTSTVYAINELQTGSGRALRFHNAQKLVQLPNIFLHRGSLYNESFDWMYYADCAIGFTVRRGQDVASCKSWEYYGTGTPVVLEEDTPETWVLNHIPNGEIAKFGDWQDFADKIKLVISNSQGGKYKRRKMRKYIEDNHGYNSRAKQWLDIMAKYP